MAGRRGADPGSNGWRELIGRTYRYAHVDTIDRRVYFAEPNVPIGSRSDFLLGAILALALVVLWFPLGIVGAVLAGNGQPVAGEWIGLRAPAIAGCLLLLTMPMLACRTRHEERLARGLRDGTMVETAVTRRAERLAAAAPRRPGYVDQARHLAAAEAMRAQAAQLESLAGRAEIAGAPERLLEVEPGTGTTTVQRLEQLQQQLRAAADDAERLVDRWLESGRA
ncbi:hypothetical protein [Nakamurella aerolata]|uniref:Uncharacterized protein n=1 Tax=Nakamurella aerolata TaxID=1656892 RepID=A0A849A239_9ACTN|nr:hypothetical protein [Nakamurella aerolata]NNG34625.1 hypothetical protein [Nakamurella aerolata]